MAFDEKTIPQCMVTQDVATDPLCFPFAVQSWGPVETYFVKLRGESDVIENCIMLCADCSRPIYKKPGVAKRFGQKDS